jgi:hypothetical protein
VYPACFTLIPAFPHPKAMEEGDFFGYWTVPVEVTRNNKKGQPIGCPEENHDLF